MTPGLRLAHWPFETLAELADAAVRFQGEITSISRVKREMRERERESEMNLPLAQGIGSDTWTGFTALWTD